MRRRSAVLLLLAALSVPARATTLTPLGCAVDAECADADACTTDVCERGMCVHGDAPDCGEPMPVEQCGNCADDDGDGLVDVDDPDCCDSQEALTLARLTIRDEAMRLALRHPLAPVADDTTLQIADGASTVVCAMLGAGRWTARRGRRPLRVDESHGHVADGVRSARLARGSFRATLDAPRLSAIVPGEVHVTLRIGTACAQGTAILRPRRRVLVVP